MRFPLCGDSEEPSELIEQLKKNERSHDTRTGRKGYKEEHDGVLGLVLGRAKDF
jgi:hypothetical protein